MCPAGWRSAPALKTRKKSFISSETQKRRFLAEKAEKIDENTSPLKKLCNEASDGIGS
jgi:hypothetical protein